MHQFTPDQAARWDAWQVAKVVSARRNDGIARLFGVTMLAATLTALAVALWR